MVGARGSSEGEEGKRQPADEPREKAKIIARVVMRFPRSRTRRSRARRPRTAVDTAWRPEPEAAERRGLRPFGGVDGEAPAEPSGVSWTTRNSACFSSRPERRRAGRLRRARPAAPRPGGRALRSQVSRTGRHDQSDLASAGLAPRPRPPTEAPRRARRRSARPVSAAVAPPGRKPHLGRVGVDDRPGRSCTNHVGAGSASGVPRSDRRPGCKRHAGRAPASRT